MKKIWTLDQPTEEGYYWIEEGIGEFKVIQLKKNVLDHLQVLFPGEPDNTNPIHLKGLKWAGPIIPPPTGPIKEQEFTP